MEQKTQTYYDWNDVQTEICKRLDIEEKYFRDYHKVIGGDYKNIWHVWLAFADHNVRNDEVCSISVYEPIGYIPDDLLKEYGDWIKPIIQIFDDIIMEYAETGYTHMNVHYHW